ncbi:hypothetical protein, partial [Prosthecochloris ethylica]|uniref:hypothetical protein n=1 Tax=Prosthecochloris ethylica TaxID=2743976 RepID=UPI001A8F93E3
GDRRVAHRFHGFPRIGFWLSADYANFCELVGFFRFDGGLRRACLVVGGGSVRASAARPYGIYHSPFTIHS